MKPRQFLNWVSETVVTVVHTTLPAGTVVGGRMGQFNWLYLQIIVVVLFQGWEVIFLRMIITVIYVAIIPVNVQNQNKRFPCSFLVPEYIRMITLLSASAAEGDTIALSPGPWSLVLDQLVSSCCCCTEKKSNFIMWSELSMSHIQYMWKTHLKTGQT